MRMIKNYLNLLINIFPIFRQFIEFFYLHDPFARKLSFSLGLDEKSTALLKETWRKEEGKRVKKVNF